MSLIHLSTELRQELKLTPQLLQSMEVLQMNSQELLDYLNQVSEENPLVEQSDLSQLHSAYEALRQKVHWINGGLPEDGHGAMPERGVTDRETESLSAFLCDQLERLRLPKPLLALSRYLAELVDEDGRLSQEDLDGVVDLKIPQALIQQALETVQGLDPAGVGARSLSECLLLQLARQGSASPLDMEIVRRFLPDLGKKHYGKLSISRRLHPHLSLHQRSLESAPCRIGLHIELCAQYFHIHCMRPHHERGFLIVCHLKISLSVQYHFAFAFHERDRIFHRRSGVQPNV